MASVSRFRSQLPVNALYTNISDCRSSIYTASGTLATWTGQASISTNMSSIGGCLFRDMGKTLYIPDLTAPATVGSQSTIMRKVQLVTGYYGTGAASSGTAAAGRSGEYFTGYIKLGGQTYGGGGDPVSGGGSSPYAGFVRAN
jgi:hypothetical protein